MAKNEIKIKINVDGKDAVFSLDKTSGAVKDLGKNTKELEKKAGDVEKSWGQLVFTLNNSLAILEKAARYTKSVFDFLKDGASYAEVSESFRAYAMSLGKSSDTIIASLRKASAGTISNKNLILTASRAMALGGLTLTNADKIRQLEGAVDDLNSMFKAELTESLISLVDFARTTGVPAMKSALDFINDSIRAIKTLYEEFGVINTTLVATAGALAGLALSNALTFLASLTTAIKAADTAQKAFNTSVLLNPLVAVGAITGLSAYSLKLNYDTYKANKMATQSQEILLNQTSAIGLEARLEHYRKLIADIYKRNSAKISKKQDWESAYDYLPWGDQENVDKYTQAIKETRKELEELKKSLEEISKSRPKTF